MTTSFSISGATNNLSLKALANEDTLLRTHCCRHKCFSVCTRTQHLLGTSILCLGHEKCFWFCLETFCVRNKCLPVCAAQETSWATMCPQQCVLVYQGLKYWNTCMVRGNLVYFWGLWTSREVGGNKIKTAHQANMITLISYSIGNKL